MLQSNGHPKQRAVLPVPMGAATCLVPQWHCAILPDGLMLLLPLPQVDQIPLTRQKRNIARDFADAGTNCSAADHGGPATLQEWLTLCHVPLVLTAEIIAHHFPRLVELHNYRSAANRAFYPVALLQKVQIEDTAPASLCTSCYIHLRQRRAHTSSCCTPARAARRTARRRSCTTGRRSIRRCSGGLASSWRTLSARRAHACSQVPSTLQQHEEQQCDRCVQGPIPARRLHALLTQEPLNGC